MREGGRERERERETETETETILPFTSKEITFHLHYRFTSLKLQRLSQHLLKKLQKCFSHTQASLICTSCLLSLKCCCMCNSVVTMLVLLPCPPYLTLPSAMHSKTMYYFSPNACYYVSQQGQEVPELT